MESPRSRITAQKPAADAPASEEVVKDDKNRVSALSFIVEDETVKKYTEYVTDIHNWWIGARVDAKTNKTFVPNTHVVFAFGTVVMLDIDNTSTPPPTSAMPFNEKYVDTWPIEQLSDPRDFEKFLLDASEHYNNTRALYGTAIPYEAISTLLAAGYPGADMSATRCVSTINNGIHIVAYKDDIINVVKATSSVTPASASSSTTTPESVASEGLDVMNDHERALIVGAEARRLDYMFPRIVSIIVKS